MSSDITIIRDRIVAEFETLKKNESGRVPEFDISLLWLTETETKRTSTYCVVVAGETLSDGEGTHEEDVWELRGKIIVWAQDDKDPSAKRHEMIEDAMGVLRRAFLALEGTIQKGRADEWEGPEHSSVMGHWSQAVIPWSCIHRRAVMV